MDFVYNAISVGVLVGICLCIVFLIGLVAHLVASEGILEKTTKIRDATGTFYVSARNFSFS